MIQYAQMGQADHSQVIKESLSVIGDVLNKSGAEYRIVGSLLVAALNGKPHRTVGDVDVVLEESAFDTVLLKLKEHGFVREEKSWGCGFFRWIEMNHERLVGFTFLLVGKFEDDYFECALTKHITIRISNKFLQKTEYTLFGFSFAGVPTTSICDGLRISNLNPKRELDRAVMRRILNRDALLYGESIDKSFKVYLFGIHLPFAYSLFSQLYNLYGGLRVMFGRRYEVWD